MFSIKRGFTVAGRSLSTVVGAISSDRICCRQAARVVDGGLGSVFGRYVPSPSRVLDLDRYNNEACHKDEADAGKEVGRNETDLARLLLK